MRVMITGMVNIRIGICAAAVDYPGLVDISTESPR